MQFPWKEAEKLLRFLFFTEDPPAVLPGRLTYPPIHTDSSSPYQWEIMTLGEVWGKGQEKGLAWQCLAHRHVEEENREEKEGAVLWFLNTLFVQGMKSSSPGALHFADLMNRMRLFLGFDQTL